MNSNLEQKQINKIGQQCMNSNLDQQNRLNRKKINYSKFEQQQINEIGQKFMNSNLEFF